MEKSGNYMHFNNKMTNWNWIEKRFFQIKQSHHGNDVEEKIALVKNGVSSWLH